MNRRQFLGAGALASAFSVAALTGCATHPTPASVANDVSLIASGYRSVLPQIGTIAGITPAIVAKAGQAIADLQAAAAAFASADAAAVQKTLVQRIEADVNAVVAVLAGLPLPAPISTILQAALVLLPIIEASVGIVAPAAAAPGGMSPSQARLALAAAR